MESKKEFKLDFIGSDNAENVRDIVAVNVYFFQEIIV